MSDDPANDNGTLGMELDWGVFDRLIDDEKLIAYITASYGKYGNSLEWLRAAEEEFPGLDGTRFAAALEEAGKRAFAHASELENFVAAREA